MKKKNDFLSTNKIIQVDDRKVVKTK